MAIFVLSVHQRLFTNIHTPPPNFLHESSGDRSALCGVNPSGNTASSGCLSLPLSHVSVKQIIEHSLISLSVLIRRRNSSVLLHIEGTLEKAI